MFRRRFLVLVASFLLLIPTSSVRALQNPSDAPPAAVGIADGYAIVILADPPLASWPAAAHTANGKIDFSHATNGRYHAALAQARNNFKQLLRARGSPTHVLR